MPIEKPDLNLESLQWQNDVLLNNHATLNAQYSTDVASVRFLNDSLTFYYSFNFYLFLVYYVFVVAAAYVIWFQNKTWSNPTKYGSLIAMAGFPFFIVPVEYGVRWLCLYLYSLLAGKVYLDPTYEHQPFSVANIFSFWSLL